MLVKSVSRLRAVAGRVQLVNMYSSKVGVLGVPFAKGQKKPGVDLAPSRLREAGLVEKLKEIGGLQVKDFGDVTFQSPAPEEGAVENMHQLAQVSACTKEVSSKVYSILQEGRVCLTLGGDHSIGIGTIDGHYKFNDNVVVLWVDAHADINTNKTSGSGSVHGMPLALLAKELSDYWPYLPTMDWQVPRFSIRNLAYIGLRSVDPYERIVIDKYGVQAFGMAEVQRLGIAAVVDMAIEHLDPRGEKSIHVSFDIDALDKLEAPSTGTSVRGGLSLREGVFLMEKLHETGRLHAIDLVEVNPLLGSAQDVERTVEAAIEVVRAGLGYSRKGALIEGVHDLPLQTLSTAE